MAESTDLKKFQRQIYLYFSEDGLIDLALGVILLGFGLLLLLGYPSLVGLLSLPGLLIWYLGKQILVFPRAGRIELESGMKRRFQWILGILVLIGLGVFLGYALRGESPRGLLASYPLAMFGLMLSIWIGLLGLLLKTFRLPIYGGLVFLALAAGEALNARVPGVDLFLTAVIAMGGIILLIGVFLLGRFLQKYPSSSREGQ